MILIDEDELMDLLQDSAWLSALDRAGVDNWQGIDYAYTLHNTEEAKRKLQELIEGAQ